MGCCHSCLECFGFFKTNTQDARTRNLGSGTRPVGSNYNYDRPYPVYPSSILPSSSNPPQIQSPPVTSIAPSQTNANVPFGKPFQLPSAAITPFPTRVTPNVIPQLNRNNQAFSNWPTTRAQNQLPSFFGVTSIQASSVSAVVTAQRGTNFKSTSTIVARKTHYGATNTSSSTNRAPLTKPVSSRSFREKKSRHNSFAKRRPSLPSQGKRNRAVVSIPPKQDNFDAIPLLCKILSSTPENLKGRLNVAQFFSKAKENWEYPVILDYINNSQSHPNFGVEVLKIIKICQRHVTEFRNRPGFDPTSHRMMLWHGSRFNNVRSILEKGLKLPETTQGSLFGNGIYFADRVSKSAPYCNGTLSGEGCLFLCDVMLGNSYPSRNQMLGATDPPTGYDSVKGIGKFIPGPSGRFQPRKFYGSKMPLGKTVPNPDLSLPFGYSLYYNEYVVYDPDSVNIKFLVYFKFTDKPFVNVL